MGLIHLCLFDSWHLWEASAWKIQNLIKSDKQISYVSRGRILIKQVRVLHLPARLLMLAHWEPDLESRVKWKHWCIENLSLQLFGMHQAAAPCPAPCLGSAHVFAEQPKFLLTEHYSAYLISQDSVIEAGCIWYDGVPCQAVGCAVRGSL